MKFLKHTAPLVFLLILFFHPAATFAQSGALRWSTDGNAYYRVEGGELVEYTLPANTKTTLISKSDLTPAGADKSLTIRQYAFSNDQTSVLIYTNTKRVWRLDTRGDYWVLNLRTKELKKLGASLPASSLMFAKFSPDGTRAAYVSGYNVYVEDLRSGEIKALTTNGNRKLINGTFDWVYEEEFACRDGFQWSPDSQHLSFWNIDANQIRDYYMINNTDSIYSQIVPVEYPKVGESPSPAKIGVVDIKTGNIVWLKLPGDPAQHYLPAMEWRSPTELFVQQLNRKQNESKIFTCNPGTGDVKVVFTENDKAWIDVGSPWENSYALDFRHKIQFINDGKDFLWLSDKDGWLHLYRIAKDGSKETLITKGAFDVMEVRQVDEKNNLVYFYASPDNATQKYLYKTSLDGKGKLTRVTPADQSGTHSYSISPNGQYAFHGFSNAFTKPVNELINLTTHKALNEKESLQAKLPAAQGSKTVEFFTVKTADGIDMDGWMVKPENFDPAKKYPVLFYVYTEPAGANVHDSYGTGQNHLYNGSLAKDGYLYITVDNRGTPAPKGREWRKSIYRKVGRLNIDDQAQAAKEILKWPFVDAERVAVWGWSGGGSATLNLMFRYPDLYKTGIAIAAVANQLTYDNIYQERYMGLPQENLQDFIDGSPVTYAKNLQGNLLYIHGTGDDNVHYANADILLNELIKYNKQFQFMSYPNRTHGISEGEGTDEHLSTLFTTFLQKNCPPGASPSMKTTLNKQ